MTYQRGQRVVLVHTDDPYTRIQPGDQGTVTHHNTATNTVAVNWDSGSQLAMCLDAGDRIQTINLTERPTTAVAAGTAAGNAGRPPGLTAVRAAGDQAGRAAADWWAQDTVGGRAAGDVAATARRILAGLADGDPAVLDTLPAMPAAGNDGEPDWYADAAGDSAPPWQTLTPTGQAEVLEAYQESYTAAVADQVSEHCRTVAGAGRDLSHLHPDRLRIGGVGVFSGDWHWTATGHENRLTVGYVGTLIARWNGWAVFSCTRPVAEAIVAEQQQQRARYRQDLIDAGTPQAELDNLVDQWLANLYLDGDVIVADQRRLQDDPEAIARISADRDGRYVVMGWNWCWEAVDPADCDRIIGDLPAPGEEQQFVLMAHTRMRVPHDRLRVTVLHGRPASPPFTATLALDDTPVAHLRADATGQITMSWLEDGFGPAGLDAYAPGCLHGSTPVTTEQAVTVLACEYEIDQAVRRADAHGGTVARLTDDDGRTLHLLPVWPRPATAAARAQLGRHVNHAHRHPAGSVWLLWDDARWWHLITVRTPTAGNPLTEQPVTAAQVLAHVIADALLGDLTREQLIDHAAHHGHLLDPGMDDQQIRAAIRAQNTTRARADGMPVEHLPTLSAADARALGQLLTGGTASPSAPPSPQS